MPIPPDYVERTYAGVLGKIIGVYLGRLGRVDISTKPDQHSHKT